MSRKYVNGERLTAEYCAWVEMRRRCATKTRPCAKNYSDRGISVCQKWCASYLAFLEDVGRRPSASHSLDRIDNSGNYEPGNVRWALWTDQQNNKRTNVFVTVDGLTLRVAEWAKRIGVHHMTLRKRLETMTPERAVRLGRAHKVFARDAKGRITRVADEHIEARVSNA